MVLQELETSFQQDKIHLENLHDKKVLLSYATYLKLKAYTHTGRQAVEFFLFSRVICIFSYFLAILPKF